MKRRLKIISVVTLSSILIAVSGAALCDNEEESFFRSWFSGKKSAVAEVDNKFYLEECGSCHFAYQPGLLPTESWKKIMSSLDDHFGENAELPEEDANRIMDYLLEDAADRSNSRISAKFLRSLRGEAPLRISEIPYFVKEHDELSRKMVQDNSGVKSFSRCDACHTDAAKGVFDEHAVKIPGFGRWEDD